MRYKTNTYSECLVLLNMTETKLESHRIYMLNLGSIKFVLYEKKFFLFMA